jgi:hypothetical protein
MRVGGTVRGHEGGASEGEAMGVRTTSRDTDE